MNSWSSSWWVAYFYWGLEFIFLSVVSLLSSEWNACFVGVLWIVAGKFTVNLFFFSSLFLLFLLLFVLNFLCVVTEGQLAFVVIFGVCMIIEKVLVFLVYGFFSYSPQPNDQLDFPPGLFWILTLVWLDSPMLLSFRRLIWLISVSVLIFWMIFI